MTNREIEEYYFKMFRRDYRLPDGHIEFGDKPDVILRGTRVIGIEITNFFLQDGSLPESEQIQRRDREAAITGAQKLYQAQGGKSFELTFSFNRSVAIGDTSELACKIAELASAVEVAHDWSVHVDVASLRVDDARAVAARLDRPVQALYLLRRELKKRAKRV